MTDMKTWEQRVAAWRSSGLSARAYSEGREFSVHMLRYWGRQVGPKAAAPASASRASSPPRPAVPAVRMARVLRTGTSAPPPPTASSAVVIEIGRVRVAVAAGFDRPTLAAVLDLLGAGVGR